MEGSLSSVPGAFLSDPVGLLQGLADGFSVCPGQGCPGHTLNPSLFKLAKTVGSFWYVSGFRKDTEPLIGVFRIVVSLREKYFFTRRKSFFVVPSTLAQRPLLIALSLFTDKKFL